MSSIMRRQVAIASGIAALAVVGFFTVLAPIADGRRNRVIAATAVPLSDSARAVHARLTVVDLHADALLWPRDLLARGRRGHVDLPRLVDGNVALQVFGAVTKTPPGLNYERNRADRDQLTFLVMASRWPLRTWSDLLQRALYQSAKLERFAARSGGALVIVWSAGDLDAVLQRRASGQHVVGGLLAMEGLQALAGNPARVDSLFDAGYRMMGLTHFFDNEVAGSSAGEAKGGLTPFGREVVRRLEERRIIVDLAHASPQTITDVLDLATRPVVVSHTGVQATCPGPRNLTDEAVRRIGANGGVIGIGYWEGAVCDLPPAAVAKAMRHVTDLIGVDHVALGSDFDGATDTAFDAAGLAHITAALLSVGFHADEVAKIMGGNAIRLLRAGLPQG